MKLTQRRIDDLVCPDGRRDLMVFDDEQRGLGVRVTAGGGKTYLAQYTFAGVKRRVPLGAYTAISLAAAREAVRAILGDVAKGLNPVAEREQQKKVAAENSLTLAALTDQWVKLHLSVKRPNYCAAAASTIRRVFGQFLDRPATNLDREAVVRALDSLAAEGKVAMASATARYGSALYGWAVRRGVLSTNPFEQLPVSPAVRRDRVLTDEEIRAVWIATEGSGVFNCIVRMLMITGQRREEVAGMTCDEVAPDFSAWTIPASRAKNGVSHVVPMSSQAKELLQGARRFIRDENDGGPDHLFPGERGVFSGWSKSKGRLDRQSGVTDWTLHDLRRTVATGLQKLGVRLEVTEAVLNHVSGSRAGIVGIYQRHEWAEEKRAALDAWGARVAAIVEGREAAGNVTPLRRSA